MIITIDGPAGAGKSTVARQLARRLGFEFLDTGAMYRAVALAVIASRIEPVSSEEMTNLLMDLSIEFRGKRIYLNGRDVTADIRTPEVSQQASVVAEVAQVRKRLVKLQRAIARKGDFVCEGRDQGTVAFPDARCKIFLTASPRVRAQRRMEELQASGSEVELDDVVAEQKIRDLRDETRAIGRLAKATDAVEIVTDNKTVEQIVDQLEEVVRAAVAN